MHLVPNSYGSVLMESNDCHEPAGKPTGGQFCSKGGGTQWTMPADREGLVLVPVRVSAVDALWRQDEDFYVTAATRDPKYARVQRALAAGGPMEASQLAVSMVGGHPAVGFIDGRHRFAAARDRGDTTVMVAMTPESKTLAAAHGLVQGPEGDGISERLRRAAEDPRGALRVVRDPARTLFLLPDGTRIGHELRGVEHSAALADGLGRGGRLHTALAAGVVRYSPGAGVEVGTPLTQAQAQVIADDFVSVYGTSLVIDLVDASTPERVLLLSKEVFEPSVETVFHISRRRA